MSGHYILRGETPIYSLQQLLQQHINFVQLQEHYSPASQFIGSLLHLL